MISISQIRKLRFRNWEKEERVVTKCSLIFVCFILCLPYMLFPIMRICLGNILLFWEKTIWKEWQESLVEEREELKEDMVWVNNKNKLTEKPSGVREDSTGNEIKEKWDKKESHMFLWPCLWRCPLPSVTSQGGWEWYP